MNIHEIYIEVKDQAQADRLKEICLKYGLPIWDAICAFKFFENSPNFFCSSAEDKDFAVFDNYSENQTEITEQQFIKLLEDGKRIYTL